MMKGAVMLYMLTGEIQTGKTRWLERRVDEARAAGIDVHGVLAPGVWRRLPGGGLEKVGIDNVLLPSGERIHLAVRRDLARSAGREEARGPSERAGLGWAMSSAAVARVDAHFANLARAAGAPSRRGLLVVDELGRLELIHGDGLVHALELLRRGPQPAWEDAVVVVRRDLLDRAHEALDAAWPAVAHIVPSG